MTSASPPPAVVSQRPPGHQTPSSPPAPPPQESPQTASTDASPSLRCGKRPLAASPHIHRRPRKYLRPLSAVATRPLVYIRSCVTTCKPNVNQQPCRKEIETLISNLCCYRLHCQDMQVLFFSLSVCAAVV